MYTYQPYSVEGGCFEELNGQSLDFVLYFVIRGEQRSDPLSGSYIEYTTSPAYLDFPGSEDPTLVALSEHLSGLPLRLVLSAFDGYALVSFSFEDAELYQFSGNGSVVGLEEDGDGYPVLAPFEVEQMLIDLECYPGGDVTGEDGTSGFSDVQFN